MDDRPKREYCEIHNNPYTFPHRLSVFKKSFKGKVIDLMTKVEIPITEDYIFESFIKLFSSISDASEITTPFNCVI